MSARAARRAGAAAAVLAAALLLAACGFGPGEPGPTGASLTVTRDFGTETVGSVPEQEFPEGETVMRLLQRHFEVETRYGGGFVQSIEGLEGGREEGRSADWFYFVNGIEAGEGAAETRVSGGDRIWWDRRDWGAAMRVPAVVGSFPEPFVSGVGGVRYPVRIDCASGVEEACDEVAERLEAVGVGVTRAILGTTPGEELLRVVVGPWRRMRVDPAARRLESGPEESGVFARVDAEGPVFTLLDARGRPAGRLGPGDGLVAATAYEEQAPTWLVTGPDRAGILAGARALDEGVLAQRYALAVRDDRGVALPVAG